MEVGFFLVFLLVPLVSSQQSYVCPTGCQCGRYDNVYTVNCSHAGLTEVPDILPPETQYLDLSSNHIQVVTSVALDKTPHLSVLNLNNNSAVTSLPQLLHNLNLRHIYVDEGAACCSYEMEWKLNKITAPAICNASIAYHECDHNLMKVTSLIIYAVVTVVSLVCNPWILVVTLSYRPRRIDPITFNSINFSIANILVTVYAAVLFGHGAAYHGDYHYHMYGWLNNPGCGFIGFVLITASLATAIFYMLEVLLIYQKLRWPLHVERHMTRRRLLAIAGTTWAGAILLAAVPFMTSVKAQYNRVGLCLPFYSGDYNFEFKYVILYTVVMNCNLIAVIVLTALLIKSLAKNRAQWYGQIPKKVADRNKALERMLLIALGVYILLNLVLTVFLIMSCIGGNTGKIGREWFARFCVLEAVTNPLVGPIRKKQFYKDSRRLLRRWGLVKISEAEMSERSSSSYHMRMKAQRNESQRQLKVKSTSEHRDAE